MKEIIGTAKVPYTSLIPEKVTVNKRDLIDKTKIANVFNKFSANIGVELASIIPTAKTIFET